jgi:hypothetical protein
MKVEEDAKIQDMIQKMETQKIELENARVELQMRQEKWMRAMEAIGQALSSPAASRDPQVLEIIKQLLGTMGTSSVPAPTPTPAAGAVPGPVEHPVHEPTQIPNTDEMDALTNSLLGLLTRKKY